MCVNNIKQSALLDWTIYLPLMHRRVRCFDFFKILSCFKWNCSAPQHVSDDTKTDVYQNSVVRDHPRPIASESFDQLLICCRGAATAETWVTTLHGERDNAAAKMLRLFHLHWNLSLKEHFTFLPGNNGTCANLLQRKRGVSVTSVRTWWANTASNLPPETNDSLS